MEKIMSRTNKNDNEKNLAQHKKKKKHNSQNL